MNNDRYSMSFTTGGLFHRESLKLSELYREIGEWNTVRDKVISENLLQARTLNTSKRICREIISRLKNLSSSELDLLVKANPQEQGYLLWLAICRRYKFIKDFAIEILRERYITLKADLSYEDFDFFLHKKSEWHSELDAIQPSTRNKLRQVLFKMLREAGLLTANNTINAAMLSQKILEAIPHDKRQDILFFPAFESDLKGIVT